jgi:hypothetical protein
LVVWLVSDILVPHLPCFDDTVQKAERAVLAALIKHNGLANETMTFAGYIRSSAATATGSSTLQVPAALRQVCTVANRVRQWMLQQRQQLEEEQANQHTQSVIDKALFLLTIAAAPSAASAAAAAAASTCSVSQPNALDLAGSKSPSLRANNLLRESLPSLRTGDELLSLSSNNMYEGDDYSGDESLRFSLPMPRSNQSREATQQITETSLLSWKTVRDWVQGSSHSASTSLSPMSSITSFIQV